MSPSEVSLKEFFQFQIDTLGAKLDSQQAAQESSLLEIKQALKELAAAIVTKEFGEQVLEKLDQQQGDILELEAREEVISTRIDDLEAEVKILRQNPSLVWLLRFKTHITVPAIGLAFILLSAFYVSDLRKWLLVLVGLPPDFPLP